MTEGAFRRLIHGRMIELQRDERDRFFAYAYRTTQTSRTLLTFGLPLLFMAGWLRDYATIPEIASLTFYRRLLLVSILLALAWIIRRRRIDGWSEIAGIAYVCLYSTGMIMTTLVEPERFSLIHVAAMLMVIILLPHALRPAVMAGTVIALVVPLVVLLVMFDASPTLWFAYLAYIVVGCAIALAQRRAYLDSALDIFQLRKRLLSRLHLDPLTAVFNRDGWDSRVQLQLQRSAVAGTPVSVAYFDIDRFKAINDLAGHAAGDEVLRTAATIIREQSRPDEIVARLGGEEFVALLPGTDEEGAYRYAERIRTAIEGRAVPFAITISAGVAMHDPAHSLVTTMERADVALLEAKRRGRNRVVRASLPG